MMDGKMGLIACQAVRDGPATFDETNFASNPCHDCNPLTLSQTKHQTALKVPQVG